MTSVRGAEVGWCGADLRSLLTAVQHLDLTADLVRPAALGRPLVESWLATTATTQG